MAYIPPSTTIQVFKDIKLYPDSDDTAYFSDKSVQNTFFSQHVFTQFPVNTYQRFKENIIRVQSNIGSLYGCNYMRYKNGNDNNGFEEKWIYAFIIRIDYINNNTVEIEYEIDYIQTWLFSPDVSFEQCYIDRQHDQFDTLFANSLPENIDTGDLICSKVETYALQSDRQFYVGILVSTLPDGTRIRGGEAYNIFTGLGMYGDDRANIVAKIQSYTDPTNIIQVFMYPALVGRVTIDDGTAQPWVLSDDFDSQPDFTRLGNYTNVRNNKLFTYPYNFVRIYSAGQERDYKWENWTGTVGQFKIHLTIMPPVTSACVPYRYLGEVEPFDNALTISTFPQCAWNDDTFKAWLAQHKASVTASLMSGALTMVSAGGEMAATEGMSGMTMMVSGFNQLNETRATLEDKRHLPPTVHGNISDTLFAATDQYDFTAKHLCVKPEIAEKIDNYFDLYGYKQNKLTYPNIHARENWTYIKTIGCSIFGDIPADDAKNINDKFNKGLRFWVNPTRIGDYSMSNLPLGATP